MAVTDLLNELGRLYGCKRSLLALWNYYIDATSDVSASGVVAVALHTVLQPSQSHHSFSYKTNGVWTYWSSRVWPVMQKYFPVDLIRMALQFPGVFSRPIKIRSDLVDHRVESTFIFPVAIPDPLRVLRGKLAQIATCYRYDDAVQDDPRLQVAMAIVMASQYTNQSTGRHSSDSQLCADVVAFFDLDRELFDRKRAEGHLPIARFAQWTF